MTAAFAAVVGVVALAASAFAASPLSAQGSGSCQMPSTDGCEMVSGSANAGALGQGTFSFTISISSESTGNGAGGFCRIANGTGSLSGSATINLAEVGFLCDVAASGGPQTFNGSFFVTGGAGLAGGVTGSGALVWSVDTGGNVLVTALGSGIK